MLLSEVQSIGEATQEKKNIKKEKAHNMQIVMQIYVAKKKERKENEFLMCVCV